jgi:hypothetical protein
MDKAYNFGLDEEPTDEQLSSLMHAVAIDVKNKADETNKKFMNQLKFMIQTVLTSKSIK